MFTLQGGTLLALSTPQKVDFLCPHSREVPSCVHTPQCDPTPRNALPRPLSICEVLSTTGKDTQAQRPLKSVAIDKSRPQTPHV